MGHVFLFYRTCQLMDIVWYLSVLIVLGQFVVSLHPNAMYCDPMTGAKGARYSKGPVVWELFGSQNRSLQARNMVLLPCN